MTPHQYEALIRLQPRLRYAVVARFGPHDADDLVQEANVAIIERANADPSYLVQQPAYLVRAGLWRAADALRRETAYLNRIAPLEFAEQPDELDLLEILAVREALAGLGERQRAIAVSLAAGRRKAEIAADLGIKRQSIYHHLAKIQVALAGAM